MKQKVVGSLIIFTLLIAGIAVLPAFAQEEGESAACQDETALIAGLLGISEDEVNQARADGSLDDLAAEKDVELSAIAEALVDNQIACDAEHQQQFLPEIVCASLEGPQMFEMKMGTLNWNGVAANALGLDMMDVLTRTGSIAELAEAQGVDVNTVIDSMVEEISRLIYEQNQRGFLSEEEASEQLSTLRDDVTEFVNQTAAEREMVSVLDAAREAIGLDVTEFYQALLEGNTLAEIASANGVSEDELQNVVIDAATASIEYARENGFISDCVTDVRLSRLEETALDYINSTNPGDLIFNPMTPAFSFGFGRPGNFDFSFEMPHGMFPIPDRGFFNIQPGQIPFFFESPEGFQFEIRPGEEFFREGLLNLENCPAVQALESDEFKIEVAPGQRGEVQIVTPEGTFTLHDMMKDCLVFPGEGE